ncbi:MAG: hypothetical protein FJZ01_13740 [Candidatus Sericytochromatia bacterium]|nr:hypothetical protein [Candidatus Tanganyikabacteria bacterium]
MSKPANTILLAGLLIAPGCAAGPLLQALDARPNNPAAVAYGEIELVSLAAASEEDVAFLETPIWRVEPVDRVEGTPRYLNYFKVESGIHVPARKGEATHAGWLALTFDTGHVEATLAGERLPAVDVAGRDDIELSTRFMVPGDTSSQATVSYKASGGYYLSRSVAGGRSIEFLQDADRVVGSPNRKRAARLRVRVEDGAGRPVVGLSPGEFEVNATWGRRLAQPTPGEYEFLDLFAHSPNTSDTRYAIVGTMRVEVALRFPKKAFDVLL